MSDFTDAFDDVIDSVIPFKDEIGQGVDAITGKTSGDAAIDAAKLQQQGVTEAIAERRRATELAQGRFQPFDAFPQRGADASQFLANPQAQFDFLQSNPLFNLALENANTQTNQRAASRGRLSAGDTLQSLSNNVLLSANPLIDRQREDSTNLLKFGGDIAASRGNIDIGQAAGIGDLITSGTAAGAGGIVGEANARTQGVHNLLNTGIQAFGGFG